jgi:probable HAF family extracellular repeat protein
MIPMRLRPFLWCAAILASLPTISRANFIFTVTDLGTLGGSTSHALAVNASGQVAGEAMNSAGNYRAFAYWEGTMIDLGTLGGDYSSASGINDKAQIVGTAATAASKKHAFLFSFATGTMIDLGTLGGDYSGAAAVNNHGFVVGKAALPSGSSRAFFYANGVMYDLGTLGGDFSAATAIDDNNVIVGNADTPLMLGQMYNQTGFIFLNGGMHNISDWGTNTIVDANGVSDAGIAGDEDGDPLGGFGSTGFIINGSLINIGTSEDVSSEDGINQAGQAVGYKVDATLGIFGPQYASIYASGVTYDLNTLVDLSSSNFTQLTEATAISNNGYIVGNGTTKSGATHAFLLTPIPAP